jgi:hypothetical protein
LGGFITTFLGWVNYIKVLFTSMIQAVRSSWDGIVAAFRPALDSLQTAISRIVNAIAPAFGDGESSAASLGNMVGKVITVFAHLVAFVARLAAMGVELYVSWHTSFIQPVVVGVKNIIGGFADIISGASTVGNALGRIFGGIGDILLAPFKGVIAFMIETISTLMDTYLAKKAMGMMGLDAGQMSDSLGNAAQSVKNFSLAPTRRVNEASEDLLEMQKLQRAKLVTPETNINMSVEAPKTPIRVESTLKVSGKKMKIATAETEIEISERAGFSDTAWQRRQILESGVRLQSAK